MGEPRRTCASTPSCPGPIRSPLRGQTHPGEDRTALPPPEALVPLYLHLLAGQAKADSGQLVDAQAWLAGSALRRRRCAHSAASRAAAGSPPRGSMSGSTQDRRATSARRPARHTMRREPRADVGRAAHVAGDQCGRRRGARRARDRPSSRSSVTATRASRSATTRNAPHAHASDRDAQRSDCCHAGNRQREHDAERGRARRRRCPRLRCGRAERRRERGGRWQAHATHCTPRIASPRYRPSRPMRSRSRAT